MRPLGAHVLVGKTEVTLAVLSEASVHRRGVGCSPRPPLWPPLLVEGETWRMEGVNLRFPLWLL